MSNEQPLAGKRILLPRASHQAQEYASQLEQLGAIPLCLPTIEIVPPRSWTGLDEAIVDLEDFDIAVFTSVNGVDAFFERLEARNQYYGLMANLTVAAVGPKTAAALRRNYTRTTLMPEDHRAEGLVNVLVEHGVLGKHILYPRALDVRPVLVENLRNAGAKVVAPVAYRTLPVESSREQICAALQAGEVDAIIFTSSSTFTNLLALLEGNAATLLAGVKLFSIGPQTSQTILEAGFEVDLQPQSWTLDAMTQALIAYLGH